MDQKNNLSSANNSKNLCSLELSQGSTNSDVDGRPVKVKVSILCYLNYTIHKIKIINV